MSNTLDRLVGMTLVATDTDAESSGLQFTGCAFSAYSKHASSKPLTSLIGLTVQSVAYSSNDGVVINFGTDESFYVSLRTADYVGPEAFCARFTDGAWVVE